MRRPHPFALTATAPLVARALGLILYYFETDPAGHPIVPAPLSSLVVALPVHLLMLAPASALALLAWNLLPRRRPWVAAATILLTVVVAVIGEVDRQMLRFLGHGFTLGTLQTYAGLSLFAPEVWRPIVYDWPHVAASVVLMAGAALAAVWTARLALRSLAQTRTAWVPIVMLLVAPAALATPVFRNPASVPPEWTLARALAGLDAMPAPSDETRASEELRALAAAPPHARWLDPRRPLVREAATPAVPTALADPALATDRPDIILLVVESLRGIDLGFASGRTPSITPTLDALAARGVALPHYISNAFSTSPAFMVIHTSMWPHRSRPLSSQLTDIGTDALPTRVRDLGYDAVAVSASNPTFDNMLTWFRRWYDVLDHELDANRWVYTRRMSDRDLVDRVMAQIERHDRDRPGRPLLLSAFTAGMHTPYTLEDSYFVPLSAAGDANRVDTRGIDDPQQRYDIVLRNFDGQLGRLLTWLDQRPRRDRTVVLVVGDHSHFTNEVLPETLRGMPIDPLVWTGAVVAGPERLIGPPRRIAEVCSHVDLMPTVLRLVGDNRPTAALGRDVLGEVRNVPTIAVRPEGIRVDRSGQAVLFQPGRPDRVWVFEPFRGSTRFQTTLAGSVFSQEELARIDRSLAYWSYLLEQDRIWAAQR